MFEDFMGLEKDSNSMSKKSVPAYESAWLGRWMGSEATTTPGQSRLSHKEDLRCLKESSVVGPGISVGDFSVGEKCRDVLECERLGTKENHGRKHGKEVLDVSPFPMFNGSQQSESIAAARIERNTLCNRSQANRKMEGTSSFHEGEGSSTQALAFRRPLTPSWMHSRRENALPVSCFEDGGKLSSNHNPSDPVEVKTTRNMLDLIRPMRIYAAVDSVEGTSGEPCGISQTTGHFLLTKTTDLNFSKDGQVFRESTVSMKLKGKMFSGFLDLFPNLDLRHREGVRLQSLGSSKDSEEGPRKNDEVKSSAVCARNESSADTDTFNMDNFQRIRLSGSNSTFSLKDQGRKNQSEVPRVEIPDMNQEPPAVPDGENSVDGDGGEASTSETQSMNVEHFLANTELPRVCKRVRSDPEPCSTWVKRLKTGASDSSGRRTMNMKIEEASPGEKVNDLFHRITKCRVTDPEPRNEEPSTSQIMNTKLGGEEITLLHPWIQRWCKYKAAASRQSTGQEIICKPAATKKAPLEEEIQKKQFPSMAAMALMGKALSGLSPSGLKKSGSLMIWNTPDLR